MGINSLIGNIGGYVGLLLGVSILQVPNLLSQVFANIMKFYRGKIEQSVTRFSENEEDENSENRSRSALFLVTCKPTLNIVDERRSTSIGNENQVKNFLNNIVDNEI